jgi:hypothetical protein
MVDNSQMIELSFRGTIFSQRQMCVFQYEVGGLSGPVSAVNVATAWWNHIKATLRPLVSSAHTTAFQTTFLRVISEVPGEYAEFAIPTGERAGTGANVGQGLMPPFVAAAIRLTVGTSLTRPGQKRISGQDESDANSANWEAAYVTKLNSFAAIIGANMVLGAPAATMELTPIVVRKPPVGQPVTIAQAVTGTFVNGQITSQNTRKVGRGI